MTPEAVSQATNGCAAHHSDQISILQWTSTLMMVDRYVQYLLEQNYATQSVHTALEAAYALQRACFCSTRYCTYE